MFTPYKRRRKKELDFEGRNSQSKTRKVLTVKEENSNPESETEDATEPKINQDWSSTQSYVQIKVCKLKFFRLLFSTLKHSIESLFV